MICILNELKLIQHYKNERKRIFLNIENNKLLLLLFVSVFNILLFLSKNFDIFFLKLNRILKDSFIEINQQFLGTITNLHALSDNFSWLFNKIHQKYQEYF